MRTVPGGSPGLAKLGPNEPCWCKSGQKYKKCHQGRDLVAQLQGSVPANQSAVAPTAAVGPSRLVEPGHVSPAQPVPEHIVKPDYATTGKPGGNRSRGLIKNADQLARMRAACRAARDILDEVIAAIRPGIATEDLDQLTHAACIRRGGYPSPLNYHGFPKSVCTSVNEVICHGIPDSRRLVEGDIINLDVTIYLEGMHGDCSETVGVGQIDAASARLIELTRECLMLGIGAVKPGGAIRDVGRAIEAHAKRHNHSVVQAFVGHGIGELFHMDPQVPHYYDPNARTATLPGMTFTIEPMINQGTWQHKSWPDRWTAVTADLKRSAQHEHTILVTERGVEILTLRAGEPQPFPH